MNTGHGHVFPRDDGTRTRCGGPGLCSECSKDLARKQADEARASRYETALRHIRDQYGQVCEEYEICTHAACMASYGSWATADEALADRAMKRGED